MKCPKCEYLGFETGDRCKNCGYDFSLMPDSITAVREADLPLREADPFGAGPSHWLDQLDRGLAGPMAPVPPDRSPGTMVPIPLDTVAALPPGAPAAAPAAAVHAPKPAPRVAMPPLPLFQRGVDDDEPLIKVPAAPRPPLAVRRTPDTPKLRAVPRPARRGAVGAAASMEPILQFADPAADGQLGADEPARPAVDGDVSGPARRLAAAGIDHAILLAIDAIVIYLTLKIAVLALGDWRVLPVVPLLVFLGMVKVAYFWAFTAVGGQTVGKMATRIRVVADEGELDPPRAIRRTLAGAVSLLALGLGLVPVLTAADRRALHDRVARTRVIVRS